MDFMTLAATAIGSDHIDTATNGQDAYSVKRSDTFLVMAVADGCGSKKRSEVGSNLFVHLCTSYFAQAIRRGQNISDRRVHRHVRDRLVADMMDLGNKMAGDEPAAEYIRDHFLFTLLVTIVVNGKLYILRIGDGQYGVNGETVTLHPTAGNKPIYLAYAILGSVLTDDDPNLLDFEIVAEHDVQDVNTAWIGSDGTEEMLDAIGVDVNGRPIEGPDDMLANEHYHDPEHPTRVADRLNEIVVKGFGTDDVTFAGVIFNHPEPETKPETVVDTDTEEDEAPGKADTGETPVEVEDGGPGEEPDAADETIRTEERDS